MTTAFEKKYIPQDIGFFQKYYATFFYVMMLLIFLLLICISIVFYQLLHRALPAFTAIDPNRNQMTLVPYTEPNLLPDTIIRWAEKAAVLAYTFDYVLYEQQLAAARPYFTPNGWIQYQASTRDVINSVITSQIFIYSVVAGTPVISNQGVLNGQYTWRVQIPFLVTYVSANTTTQRNFYVIMTIIPVPTSVNPQGIGIDQFVMV